MLKIDNLPLEILTTAQGIVEVVWNDGEEIHKFELSIEQAKKFGVDLLHHASLATIVAEMRRP